MELRERVTERVDNMFNYLGVGPVPGIPDLVANVVDVLVNELLTEIIEDVATLETPTAEGEWAQGFGRGASKACTIIDFYRPVHGRPAR